MEWNEDGKSRNIRLKIKNENFVTLMCLVRWNGKITEWNEG